MPTLRELGMALVAYSPLGRGVLTGAITDAGQFRTGASGRADAALPGPNSTAA